MNKSVVILRPNARDKFGDPVDPANPYTKIPESGWVIAPGQGSDLQTGLRNEGTDYAMAYISSGKTAATYSDHVLIDGIDWQIAGNPSNWESPYSGFKGTTVPLERFSG